jgi:hypothetical protein
MRVFEGKSGVRIFNVIRNLLIWLKPPSGSSPSLSTIYFQWVTATHVPSWPYGSRLAPVVGSTGTK